MNPFLKGDFTLPGEAGYEELTLKMAERWGADVIRDSDGTKLSPQITEAGYRIYSTICIIREHNEFALQHPETQQQTFLFSGEVVARGGETEIRPLEGYFEEQFQLNDTEEALRYWQVWDRTAGREVPRENWSLRDGTVTVDARPITGIPCLSWPGASGKRSTCTTIPPTTGRASTCGSWIRGIPWRGSI